MNTIHANYASMVAQRSLMQQTRLLEQSLTRLSTGLRINRAADDPSGLIASESHRSDLVGIEAAMSNAGRAEQMLNAADAGLQELNTLLLDLQSIVLGAGDGTSNSGLDPTIRQQEIEAILEAIDHVANGTTFNGQQLLNGELGYVVENKSVTDIKSLQIHAARLGQGGASSVPVQIDVQTPAAKAGMFIDVDSTNASGTFFNGGGGSVTFEFSGTLGVQQFTFAPGTTITDMVDIINSFTGETGVEAAVSVAGESIVLTSSDYGSDAFVEARVIEGEDAGVLHIYDGDPGGGGAPTGWPEYRSEGSDAEVLVNGVLSVSKGLEVHSMNTLVDMSFQMTELMNLNQGSTNFQIMGGGASFQFDMDPQSDLVSSLGIESVTTGSLGGYSGTLASMRAGNTANLIDGDTDLAERIISEAIDSVTLSRARIGAFQRYTIGSSVRGLLVAMENTTAAQSQVRDADIAYETSALAQAQIIQQAAMYALGVANTQSATVLALLG
ncbi:MAG: flagellin [Phycisphaerales bacterium]|nr:flagellin [Phycisphaerales bacterium]